MNHQIQITCPIYMSIPRKTKKDKNITLNMNWYRNAYFHESNYIKQEFKKILADKLQGIKIKEPYGLSMVLYYKRNCDIDNFDAVISKFFNDGLKELGCISDDNVDVFKFKSCTVGGQDKENPRMEINIINL